MVWTIGHAALAFDGELGDSFLRHPCDDVAWSVAEDAL